jgi:hypothetical protein
MMTRRTLLNSTLALSTAAALSRPGFAAPHSSPAMSVILGSPRFLVNGVATDAAGAVYLSMPRWTGMDDTPGVGKLHPDGTISPFPGGAWHNWRDGPAAERLLQSNALRVFDDNLVWIVDQGAPDRKTVKPGGQKLLAFRADGTLAHRLDFDKSILPEGATMNDLRKQGSRIYVTDSGIGGLIVHDLDSGRSLRRLSKHPDLMVEQDRVQVGVGGRPLEDADGKRPRVNADMIELSADGKWLYWAFPAGPLRRIETVALWNEALGDGDLAERIETVSEIPPIGGTAIDSIGNIYLSDVKERRIAVLTPRGKTLTLVQDDRLVSPDAIWIDADRRLMVPAPQTERLPDYAKGMNETMPPFLVLGMTLPETFEGHPLGDAVFVPRL